MSRRFWPAALTVVSLIVFGTYLGYTQYVVRQVERDARAHRSIIALVQQGVLQIGTEGAADLTLLDLQQRLLELDVPIVFFNAEGEPQSAGNLPFAWDLDTEDGRRRVHAYAMRLAAARPENVISLTGVGSFYFGDPPILRWLRWVPFLQVGAGVLLALIAVIMLRSGMRAHREALWSAMARELAHQMGTPLSSLSGWVEVLQLPPGEREQMAPTPRIGRLMQVDVERLERVSRRFELIGKRQPLVPVRVDRVVEELVQYFRPRLPHLGKGIALRSRVAAGMPPIAANEVLLIWALENIVRNAVDALGGRGGRISIMAGTRGAAALNTAGGMIHIVIADNGPGIAPSVRSRIFEPGVSTKSGGWGVGLSLSRRIIEELHNGRIVVEDRPSGGTVFDVALPVVRT